MIGMLAQPLRYRPYGLTNPAARLIENPVNKDFVAFNAYGSETGGIYTEFTVTVLPGGSVPKHLHTTYTERMTPVSGNLGLELDIGPATKQVRVSPGESILVARNQWHHFYHPGDTDERTIFRVRCEPAHQGFEILLAVGYGLARDGKTYDNGVARNPFDMLWMLAVSDMHLPGSVMRGVMFIAGLVLWMAEVSGRKDRLVRRYYGVPITEQEHEKKQS